LGDIVAAGAGLLLIISLFLNWYSASAKATVGGFTTRTISESASGWKALGFIDILLFICALVAIGIAVARVANVMPRNLPVSPGLLVLGVGGLATVLVIFRILSIPHGDVPDVPGIAIDFSREFGIFVALIGAIGVAVGGWLTWNEEGKPTPAGAGGAGPLGAGQPGGQGYGQPPAGQGYGQQQPPAQGYAQPPTAQQPQAAAPPAQPAAPAAAPAGGGEPAPPAGGKADWYPDPRGQKRLRYYDGTSWTEHVAD
jgi:hypothetical protein